MSIRVEVDDTAVRKALDQDVAEMAAAVGKAELAGAEMVADQARRLVPVRSGRLRRSIRVEGNQAVAGGSTAPYAGVIEYGRTRPRTRAQPFLAAAAHQVETQVVADFDQAVDRVVED